MNFTNLGGNIFNLDNIVMVEEYNGTGKGLVHCMDGHTYTISESEYKALVELLGETRPY